MCVNNKIMKGQGYMENGKKMYVTAEEAAEKKHLSVLGFEKKERAKEAADLEQTEILTEDKKKLL